MKNLFGLIPLAVSYTHLDVYKRQYIDDISPYIQSFITEEQINEITRAITNLLNYIATQILQFGTGMITNMTGFIISVLTTIILSIYFLKDKETLTRSVYKAGQTLLTPNGLKRSQQFLKDLDAVFGGFLIAQLIAAILAGILDRKSTRLNSSHLKLSRMPSSA